jgi:phosphatidylglycerophosphatase A
MPGTVASFAAVIVAFFIPVGPVLILSVIVLGLFASGIYAKTVEKEDPGEIVIDEVAGMWIALFAHSPAMFVPAFGLFRILDIIKPFPIRNLEKLPGGVGIMADDIAAGVLANVILRSVWWLLFCGGIERLLK